MSLITWRYRDESGGPTGPTYYIEFDAVTLEEFNRPADITDYPVESGGVLSDHYQPLPYQITLVAEVTDTPMTARKRREGMTDIAPLPAVSGYPKQMQSAATAQRGEGYSIIRPIASLPSERLVRANIERVRLRVPFSAPVLHFTQEVTRIVDVFRAIDGLMETKTPVSVIMMGDIEFDNMFITNHRAPRVSGSGGRVEFALDLRHIASAGATKISALSQRDSQFAQKRDTGRTATAPVESGTVEYSRQLNTPWYDKVPDSVKTRSVLGAE